MTYDEKKKLSADMNILEEEQLDDVAKIIKDRMPQLCQNSDGEMVVIDIEALDTPTLRHLERFIKSIQTAKRNRSRSRSKKGGTNSMSSSTGNGSNTNGGNTNKLMDSDLQTQQKIADMEADLKKLTDKAKAITQRGLARSAGLLVEEDKPSTPAPKKEEVNKAALSDSESDSESESSDSDSSESDLVGASTTSTSTSSVSANNKNQQTSINNSKSNISNIHTTPSNTAASTTPGATVSSHSGATNTAAPTTITSAVPQDVESSGAASNNNGISFSVSLNSSLSNNSPIKSLRSSRNTPPKLNNSANNIEISNLDDWSSLAEAEVVATQPAASVQKVSVDNSKINTQDETWSNYQNRKMQNKQKEMERIEKEERMKKEREVKELEKKREEEKKKKEMEEEEVEKKRLAEEAEQTLHKEREQARLAAKLARQKAAADIQSEKSLLMTQNPFEGERGGAAQALLSNLFPIRGSGPVDKPNDPNNHPPAQ